MVNTYGATATSSSAEAVDDEDTNEHTAFLGDNRDITTTRKEDKADGHASITSSISNLANTIIGSGARRFVSSRSLSSMAHS